MVDRQPKPGAHSDAIRFSATVLWGRLLILGVSGGRRAYSGRGVVSAVLSISFSGDSSSRFQ